jgi:RDD family
MLRYKNESFRKNMTCQACQTWNSDQDHRCRRCGRRFRVTPTRHVRDAYPIAATALAYQPEADLEEGPAPATPNDPQQILFANPNEARVIPFDQLTSPAERESIRARAAQLTQPSPVKSGKVEVSAARRNRRGASKSDDQQQFDFFGKSEIVASPPSAIQCGAPVAPPLLRLSAAVVDGFMILLATVVFLVGFRLATGSLPVDKFALIAYGAAFVGLNFSYKVLWCFANRDSFGLSAACLRVVDFDGNVPDQKRRFWRALASFLSLGAVGLGLVWTFADADALAWHDQISGTFPTFSDE